MSTHITGIINPNINNTIAIAIENNMKALPLVISNINGNSGNVTIPDESITSSQIQNFTIVNNDISTTANISGSKLADASITSAKIDSSGTWSFVNISANFGNIRDLSVNNNMSISGNLEPLNNTNTSKLGSTTKYWSNAYISDISASNISVSSHIRIGHDHYGGKIIATTTSHELIIDPYSFENSPYTGNDASGRVVILGDLIVRGDTTTINSATIDISDLTLNIASNATKNIIYGIESGIKLGSDSYASLLYNKDSNSWITNIGIEISGSMKINENINVSGNLEPLNDTNTSRLGSINRFWSNAYIRDLSVVNISVSGTVTGITKAMVDLSNVDNTSDLLKPISTATQTELNLKANISVSGDISNVTRIIPRLTSDISTSLGTSQNTWQKAFISDLSGITRINGTSWPLTSGSSDFNGLDINTNLIPRNPVSIDLGSSSKYWRNAYIDTISAKNISISGNLTTDISNFRITSTHRIYQNISGDISWNDVNGYYGLAKDAYPSLNPYSSEAKALTNWTGRFQGVQSNTWSSICWSPELGIFVAVAVNGNDRVMTSHNGISWTSISGGVDANNWFSVCWSPQRKIFVAVANQGTVNRIMSSSNGTSWTSISGGVNVNYWNSVCWSPELGLFVAVGNFIAMTSPNGISWTTTQQGVSANHKWESVCWSPELGLFVAVGSSIVMTSHNGISWTGTSLGVPSTRWKSVCWSPQLGIFVAVGDLLLSSEPTMYSRNGKSWTGVSLITDSYTSVCWSPELGLFVAVGFDVNNNVMTSYDGINWTMKLTLSSNWTSICWSPELGVFVAVGQSGSNRVMTSSLKGRPPTSFNVFDSSFNSIDESGNWTFSNISVSGNIIPLYDASSELGSSSNYWSNAYIRDISASNISVSGNINVDKNISISGNIIPLYNIESDLGSSTNYWRNAYISDISASNISVSSHIRIGHDHYGGKIIATTTSHELIIDPYSFENSPYTGNDASGRVVILGDLIVRGDTTTINSATIDISDLTLNIASNATKNIIYGIESGIKLGSDSYASLLYNKDSNSWITNIGIEISGSMNINENINVSGHIIPSTNSELGSNTKSWSKAYITDLNVTNSVTIPDETITSSHIKNLTIVNNDISTNADISGSKLADASIASSKIDSSGTWTFTNISGTHMSISGNLEPLNNTITSRLGSTTKYWSNAYINDISVANITISGTINIPSSSITSNHIADFTIVNNDISTNADISGSKLADASITSAKIDSSGTWSFVNISANFGNIRDLSANNMTISGNLEPNSDCGGSLGVSGKMWGNAYICDLDVSNITTNAFNIGNIAFTISGNTLILRLKTL